MKAFIYALIIFLAAVAVMMFAPDWMGHRGYILIAMGDLRLEMTVIGAAIMLFAAVFLLLAITRLLRAIMGLFTGRLQKQQAQAFFSGVYALAEGRLEQAQALLAKAKDARFGGLPSLLGAEVAKQRGDKALRQTLLQKAAVIKDANISAIHQQLTDATREGDSARANALLQNLSPETAKHPTALKLQLQLLAASGRWSEMQSLLLRHKKRLGDHYEALAQQAAVGLMSEVASKEGAHALKQYWQELPRKLQQQLPYRIAYLQQLLAQGMHQDAEHCLISWQIKGPEPALYPWFAKLSLSRPHASMQLLESWIKRQPNEVEFYSLLGQLAAQAGDHPLATNALRKALSIVPRKQDLLLLAQLQEQQRDLPGALASLRQASSM